MKSFPLLIAVAIDSRLLAHRTAEFGTTYQLNVQTLCVKALPKMEDSAQCKDSQACRRLCRWLFSWAAFHMAQLRREALLSHFFVHFGGRSQC